MTEMVEKVSMGEAVDLSAAPMEGKCYVVEHFNPELDYCDLKKHRWMKSVARRRVDGAIHAHLDFDLHERVGYIGLWLR